MWCDSTCSDGFFFGPEGTCKEWQWKQCKVSGKGLLIAELAAVGIVLLAILICVLKCCCCQKKRTSKGAKLGKIKKQEKERLMGDEEEQVSSTPRTDEKRAEMRLKWGSRISEKSVN